MSDIHGLVKLVVSIVGDIKWSLMSDIHGLVVSNVGDITCKWSLMSVIFMAVFNVGDIKWSL
jgi:hypothetical protein